MKGIKTALDMERLKWATHLPPTYTNPFDLTMRCQDFPDACFNCHRCDKWVDFWELCEREWAEQFKFYAHYGEPCECGSSVCDECNPGWDQEPEEWELEEEDCPY